MGRPCNALFSLRRSLYAAQKCFEIYGSSVVGHDENLSYVMVVIQENNESRRILFKEIDGEMISRPCCLPGLA